jgi:adenine-specific DNA glycosylase
MTPPVCADTAASVASIAFQQPAAAVDGAPRTSVVVRQRGALVQDA